MIFQQIGQIGVFLWHEGKSVKHPNIHPVHYICLSCMQYSCMIHRESAGKMKGKSFTLLSVTGSGSVKYIKNRRVP